MCVLGVFVCCLTLVRVTSQTVVSADRAPVLDKLSCQRVQLIFQRKVIFYIHILLPQLAKALLEIGCKPGLVRKELGEKGIRCSLNLDATLHAIPLGSHFSVLFAVCYPKVLYVCSTCIETHYFFRFTPSYAL